MENDFVIITDDGKVVDKEESRISRLIRQMVREIQEEEDAKIFEALEAK
jgi:hypothetical protein